MPEAPLIEPQQQAGRHGGAEQSGVGARVESAAQLRPPGGKADSGAHLETRDARQGEFLGSGYPRLARSLPAARCPATAKCGRDHLRGTVNHRVGVQVVEFEAVHERPVGQWSLAGRHAYRRSPERRPRDAALIRSPSSPTMRPHWVVDPKQPGTEPVENKTSSVRTDLGRYRGALEAGRPGGELRGRDRGARCPGRQFCSTQFSPFCGVCPISAETAL